MHTGPPGIDGGIFGQWANLWWLARNPPCQISSRDWGASYPFPGIGQVVVPSQSRCHEVAPGIGPSRCPSHLPCHEQVFDFYNWSIVAGNGGKFPQQDLVQAAFLHSKFRRLRPVSPKNHWYQKGCLAEVHHACTAVCAVEDTSANGWPHLQGEGFPGVGKGLQLWRLEVPCFALWIGMPPLKLLMLATPWSPLELIWKLGRSSSIQLWWLSERWSS